MHEAVLSDTAENKDNGCVIVGWAEVVDFVGCWEAVFCCLLDDHLADWAI